MNIDKEIGQRVKSAIRKAGYLQKLFAEKLGLSEDTLTSYVIGKRNIPEENLKRIAELTGVSVQWLKTGVEDNLKENAASSSIIPHLDYSKQGFPKELKDYLQTLIDTNQFQVLARISVLLLKIEELEEQNKQLIQEIERLRSENNSKTF